MVSFPDPVAIPNYNALRSPAIDFSWLADLPNQYYKGQQNQFQQRQRQRTEQLQQPINSTDPSAIAQTLLQRGGADYAAALFPFLQQQQNLKAAGAIDPMLPGPSSQPQVGNPPPASAAGALPTNMKTPVSAQSGDPGTGTITDIVTDKYGETADAGRMIARVAMTMNVDPNVPLSQGQQVRVAGLVKRYGGDKTTDAGNGISVTAPANEKPTARVADAFAAASGGGDQPPAPQRTGAVVPQPAQPQPQPNVQPQPQAPAVQQGSAPGPIGPQVPLPRGYTDPEQAILALRERAAQVERIAPGQAKFFDAWADRIEKSVTPQPVNAMTTLIQPRTGAIVYQGPGAQAFRGTEAPETLDADAERYRQTGTLPPNMGRGQQGQALAAAVRTRATEQEIAAGGNPAQWSQRWAQFKNQGGYADTVKNISDGIVSGDQPPVLTGLGRNAAPVRSELQSRGFNLTKAQLEWTRAQKQIQALNGPQMTRFVGLAQSVDNTIDEVTELAHRMQLSGIPKMNEIELAGYIQTRGNTPNGQLATQYITAVGTLKEEFANLANGGYAPTEPAWSLANKQINENYGVYQLPASLREIQRLIRYRVQAIPGLTSVGPAAANPYTGQPAAQGPMFNLSTPANAGGGKQPAPPAGFQLVQ